MKKFKINNAQILSKEQQKETKGGMSFCHPFYFEGPNGRCAVPGPNGEAIFGMIINGQCCV